MFQDLWLLMSIGVPALGLYYCLSTRSGQDCDEASHLPFDDELNDAFTMKEEVSGRERAARGNRDDTLPA